MRPLLFVLIFATQIDALLRAPSLRVTWKEECDRIPVKSVYVHGHCFVRSVDTSCGEIAQSLPRSNLMKLSSVDSGVVESVRRINVFPALDESNVCVFHAGFRCPDGYEMFEDYCYKVMNRVDSFQNANALCKNDGAHLPIIESDSINQKMQELINSVIKAPTWLGIRYTAGNWGYEGRNEDVIYFRWMHANAKATNAVMDFGIYSGFWRTADQGSQNAVICQRSAKPTI